MPQILCSLQNTWVIQHCIWDEFSENVIWTLSH